MKLYNLVTFFSNLRGARLTLYSHSIHEKCWLVGAKNLFIHNLFAAIILKHLDRRPQGHLVIANRLPTENYYSSFEIL